MGEFIGWPTRPLPARREATLGSRWAMPAHIRRSKSNFTPAHTHTTSIAALGVLDTNDSHYNLAIMADITEWVLQCSCSFVAFVWRQLVVFSPLSPSEFSLLSNWSAGGRLKNARHVSGRICVKSLQWTGTHATHKTEKNSFSCAYSELHGDVMDAKHLSST